MEKVGNVTSKFKNSVDVKMKSTISKEARQYAIKDSCIVVDGEIRLSADFDEKQLEEAITLRVSK
jgi:hypothetical protein